jgi:mannose-6-phosphate isomerase-like protein (cupin superfamily)
MPNAPVSVKPFVVEAEEGRPVWFLETHMTLKATSAQTAGTFGVIDNRARAGFSPPMHVHRREDEAFYVLEGRLTVACGHERFEAGPGSFVFLPRDVPHTFLVGADEPARMLTMIFPGGFEQFFVDGGHPALDDTIPALDPADFETINALNAEYGVENVGPPLMAGHLADALMSKGGQGRQR